MDHQAIIQDLLQLLGARGVTIRQDAMGGGGGGICYIKGKKVFFFDTDSTLFETAVTCANAVQQEIKDLEIIYIKPAIRDFIDKYTPTR